MNQTIELIDRTPTEILQDSVRSVLEHAVDGHLRGLKVYESLQSLNEVIGTEYGSRVLYELIQNAHDAHHLGETGRIAISLKVASETDGILYIANGGEGFREKDVEAIKNIALSGKKVGEGIGNKGLGFRSIEALTNDVRIYSQNGTYRGDRFDGYCFGFAGVGQITDLLQEIGTEDAVSQDVALNIPRYLVPVPLEEQSDEVLAYSKAGFATVIVAPLKTADSVALAIEQVESLANLEVPLMLFLDRISEISIDVQTPQSNFRHCLQRRQKLIGKTLGPMEALISEVDVGQGRRFLVISRDLEMDQVKAAVQRSIPKAPQLKRWLDWEGEAAVSVAVGLSPEAVNKGRLYNYLPMGRDATSPILGYLNAPFFADIDRRNADLGLPLNDTLMQAAAEACAASALFVADRGLAVPSQAVFDLIAWTGPKAAKMAAAFELSGTSLDEAPVIPVIAVKGGGKWSSLSKVTIWPQGTFSIMKGNEVAKRLGAHLVSRDLDDERMARLREVAEEIYLDLDPSGQLLAGWAEAFAKSLLQSKGATAAMWSRYYEDLRRVYHSAGVGLQALVGKEILYDRSKRLRPAGGHEGGRGTGIFVRSDATQRKHSKATIPLPPPSLNRRFRFLHEQITLSAETLQAFFKAGLIREYDPVKALSVLNAALGENPTDDRRRDALVWAFQLWQHTGDRIKKQLQDAHLYVPTTSGWKPAHHATFSASWSSTGRTLESYLIEAAEVSADCRHARSLLLASFDDWPGTTADKKKRQWKDFLELIGVIEGFRPVAAKIVREGKPAYVWDRLLQLGSESEGLDDIWCREASGIRFNCPYTSYTRKGQAWRLPGQMEHDQLPSAVKELFFELVFDHLKSSGARFFNFKIGRFDRPDSQWFAETLPTPLATFLRSRPWLAISTPAGLAFRNAANCWAARTKRNSLPRFLDCLPQQVSDLADNLDLAALAFSSQLGLRDWENPKTAPDRLVDLASAIGMVGSHDRPAFRRQYQRAWENLIEEAGAIRPDLSLAISRRGQFEELQGDSASPPNVIVTQEAERTQAHLLSSSGQAILDVGSAPVCKVVELLQNSGRFCARSLDGEGVQLLVDGESFYPRSADPSLMSLGLGWLPEIAVIGHELLGERLERGIHSSTVDRRARSIRVRQCESISLLVDGEPMEGKQLDWYAYDHDTNPTLILSHRLALGWRTLAERLSTDLSRLIDSRLRSLDLLLLKLALRSESDELNAPGDEALAAALECDVQTIQDHRAAFRTDFSHVLNMLLPVVGYFGGLELAQQLRGKLEAAVSAFDVEAWLSANLADATISVQDLISTCEQTADRVMLRRILKLDFLKFNCILQELGEQPISNEVEQRRFYGACIASMRAQIIDRLRQHHVSDFREGRDLANYLERKSLEFLQFDPTWVRFTDTLEIETIQAHVSKLLEDHLGLDQAITLPSLERLIERNRKLIREFATQAMPLVGAWCRRNDLPLPEPWKAGDPQILARSVENTGLLDFEQVTIDQVVGLCSRAGIWPTHMPLTLDHTVLGIRVDEIEEEERLRERERRQRDVDRNSISFAGVPLDTGDPKFVMKFQQLAEQLSNDGSWYDRSRKRVKLARLESSSSTGGGGSKGGKGGSGRREQQLTDAQRSAMGLASEWLAFQFLRSRHGDVIDENCWISRNRVRFFGGSEGDDLAGYDFIIKTPRTDWFYEVKSTLEDSGEFELSANEMRVASSMSKGGRRRYRILYVPFVFSPDRWCVLELPNPMGEGTRNNFAVVGRGSVRLRFERE